MGAYWSREANKSRVVEIHSAKKWKDRYEEYKGTGQLMVIDFSASWCGPCRYMEPIFNEFATKFTDVVFIRIDVDELADVAKEFGIQAMPTFVFMKNGKEVDKLVGADREELERKIHKYML